MKRSDGRPTRSGLAFIRVFGTKRWQGTSDPRQGPAVEAARKALQASYDLDSWSAVRGTSPEPAQPAGVRRGFHIPATYNPYAPDPVSTVSTEHAVPLRVVTNYKQARHKLTSALRQAERQLGVGSDVALMPYVLVMTDVKGRQRIFPGAKDRKHYQDTRHLIDNAHPMLEYGSLKPGNHGKADIQALREYAPGIGGFLIAKKLRGAIYDSGGNLPLGNEPYGPYSYFHGSVAFNLEGDAREAYGKSRGPVTAGFRRAWNHPQIAKQLVTLGPQDDIVGIMSGQYTYANGNWVPKPK